jgi:hypothetical protein
MRQICSFVLLPVSMRIVCRTIGRGGNCRLFGILAEQLADFCSGNPLLPIARVSVLPLEHDDYVGLSVCVVHIFATRWQIYKS